jgi:hypothetical protein
LSYLFHKKLRNWQIETQKLGNQQAWKAYKHNLKIKFSKISTKSLELVELGNWHTPYQKSLEIGRAEKRLEINKQTQS